MSGRAISKLSSSHSHCSWRQKTAANFSFNYSYIFIMVCIGCSVICNNGVRAFVSPRNSIDGLTRTATTVTTSPKKLLPPKPFSTISRVGHKKTVSKLSMIAKSGGTPITTAEQFESDVLSTDASRPVLVFFSAPWCGPCRLSNPVVRDVMKQFAGRIDVVEVCTDDLPEVAADAGVVSIPTIQVYYGGSALDTIVGCVARNVLASAVTKILEDLGQGDPEDEEDDAGGQEGVNEEEGG
uniref:Thioredoxin domain-containing protein n=1 Tax=Ditylum brightwellii TaxID=49249 RepID=A0A6U3R6L7_9STRA|mmetsp:Transcript_24953/g.37223  ORF Transcript_24953/g.37223 Transcript_24953/m.37223 type:complete len:239 (+) Transcript_24953:244-960(+)